MWVEMIDARLKAFNGHEHLFLCDDGMSRNMRYCKESYRWVDKNGHEYKEALFVTHIWDTDAKPLKGEERREPLKLLSPDAPTITNENGAKQSFTGTRLDLLPAEATLRIGRILHDGAAKYGDDNWRGIPVNEHLNHALTHLYGYLAGDTQDDHLGHAACRLMFAVELAKGEA